MAYGNYHTLARNHYTGGRYHLVRELIVAGAHTVEIWGNSKEGFEPYIVSGNSGVSLSSGRFFLRRDCVAACRRAYGEELTFANGRNWL